MRRAILIAIFIALVVIPSAGASTVTPADYSSAQLESMANATSTGTTGDTSVDTTSTTGGITCWNHTQTLYYGTWPQQHNLVMFTHWCGSGRGWSNFKVTSHYTNMSGETLFCSYDHGDSAVTGGGDGLNHVTVLGEGYFTCPTGIPYFNLHFHEWMNIEYGPGGYVAILSRS